MRSENLNIKSETGNSDIPPKNDLFEKIASNHSLEKFLFDLTPSTARVRSTARMAGNQGESTGLIRGRVQGALKMTDQKYLTVTSYIKNFFSEMFGTAVLVFLGCMGVRTGESHFGVALSFGISAFIAIQICCHNSGGHINPALTLASLFFKKVTIPMAITYIAGQMAGAVLGYGLLLALLPPLAPGDKFCTTLPLDTMTDFKSVTFEAVMTAVLILVVCSIWDSHNGTLLDSATLKFGFAIFALAYAGGSITGCSMNPARSFGPAVWHNDWRKHWIYWVGPSFGGVFGGFIYTTFFCGPITKISRDNKIEMEAVSTS